MDRNTNTAEQSFWEGDYFKLGAGCNPVWLDQCFTWGGHGELVSLCLTISCWDRETFGSDDFVGGGRVDVMSLPKGEPARRWINLTQKGHDAGRIELEITVL